MATAMEQPAVMSGPTIDSQLAALLARQCQLVVAIERRAAEVVGAWLVDHDRTWLAVDFTKTRPEPPFDGEDALAAGVSKLPGRVFGGGLDVRGRFIVRLSGLNTYLNGGDDRAPAEYGPRIEVLIVRDPDGGTAATAFLDNAELGRDDYEEYVVDAGRGHVYADLIQARDLETESASPSAAAPEGWPFEGGGGPVMQSPPLPHPARGGVGAFKPLGLAGFGLNVVGGAA